MRQFFATSQDLVIRQKIGPSGQAPYGPGVSIYQAEIDEDLTLEFLLYFLSDFRLLEKSLLWEVSSATLQKLINRRRRRSMGIKVD